MVVTPEMVPGRIGEMLSADEAQPETTPIFFFFESKFVFRGAYNKGTEAVARSAHYA